MSFLPTEYRGLSELGQIAGVGMIIAFLVSITLMPGLLSVFDPPAEKEPLGYRSLAPVDRFLDRHRIAILVATAVVSLGGLPLLYFLQFDFNPMNLRSAKTESIATYLELRRDPAAGGDVIDVVAPSLADARNRAERLSNLPEVERVIMLDTFIPADQEKKTGWIGEAAKAIEPLFHLSKRPLPTDEEIVEALRRGSEALTRVADSQTGRGAESAKHLAGLLSRVANGDEASRKRADTAFAAPLGIALNALRGSLMPQQVTIDSMPPQFLRHWLQPDGSARVEVHPKSEQVEGLRNFARAVLAVEPQASGSPVLIHEKGDMIVRAFIKAGICALVSIALLLWITLRRLRDVGLTLIPLVLAGVVTLEICVLIGLKLNFANIIALPLLLGIGVAFKIYYIMAWRAGQTGLLQSPLTRAVIFSALTTATAFGSLWLSSHPGMSSMGKLLALSLVCTLAAAVLFQPVLMGPPREVRDN
jgi:hopanoid biosynthesis associated RND transporter like protein HpnN